MSFGNRKLVAIGNYRLCGVSLGEGSFGKVELAAHVKAKSRVALKIVFIPDISDAYVVKNLHREASILLAIKHPNIARLIEVCRTDTIFCMCIEFVEGKTLLDTISPYGRFPEHLAKAICGQLIGAVFYLHSKGILHRDLKLENVMLSRNRVVLLDFGLSTLWAPGKNMNTHCGSPEYAAPELFLGDEHYGPAVDIWSFGIILFALTIGRLPFQVEQRGPSSATLASLINKVSKGLSIEHKKFLDSLTIGCRNLIRRCLDVKPATRISAHFIVNDPWIIIGNPLEHKINTSGKATSKEVAVDVLQKVKEATGADCNYFDIVKHIKKRPHGTIAGLYRLLEMDYERYVAKVPLKDVTNTVENPRKEATEEFGQSKTKSILRKTKSIACQPPTKKSVRFHPTFNETVFTKRKSSMMLAEEKKKIYMR